MLVPILISLLLAQSVALVFLVWAVWPVIVTEWKRITEDDGEAALRAEDFRLVDAWLKACRAENAARTDMPRGFPLDGPITREKVQHWLQTSPYPQA